MHCFWYKVAGLLQLVQLKGPGPSQVAQEKSHSITLFQFE